MEHSKKNTGDNAVWQFFCSVRLTVVLLILLAIASVLGTMIPQREGAAEFARTLSPQFLRFFAALDLFDMYHSTWFRLLIGCLTLNLVCCSINRFPGTWKRFRASPRADRRKPFEDLPPERSILIPGEANRMLRQLDLFIRKRYRHVEAKESTDGRFYCGEKGRYAHFGFYLVHASVILILAGAIVGSLAGFEAFVTVPEGEVVREVVLRPSMTRMPLDFQVRCDKFTVTYYENGTPKEYRSDVTFLSGGQEVRKAHILVNHPVTFEGVTFYQSSFDTLPGGRVRLVLLRGAEQPDPIPLEVQSGTAMDLPGGEGRFQVLEVYKNFREMLGPAALIAVQPTEGEELRFLVFKDYALLHERFPPQMLKAPILNPSAFKPYTFQLEGVETKYYTGLQVNRDPGVAFVWTGCFLMVVGFFITFFTSHRRIWLHASPEEQGMRIRVAGVASKNPVGLERELDHLTRAVRDSLSEKGVVE